MKQIEKEFDKINTFIEQSRNATVGFMNYAAVATYWTVGAYVSCRLKNSAWGAKTIVALEDYLKTRNPHLKGFGRRQLYNMVEFYDTYSSDEFQGFYERLKLNEFVQALPASIVHFQNAQFGGSEIVHLENPAIGILLCPKADAIDVRYTLDRTMSPTMVTEYQRLLIPKEVLCKSLEEYCAFMKVDLTKSQEK